VPTEMSMAHRLGYDPLIMVGADFAFGKDQTRFTGKIYDQKEHKWTENRGGPVEGMSKKNVVVRTKAGRLTEFIHIYYRKTTGVVQWLDGANCMDCSDGIATGLWPKYDIQEVVNTQGAVCLDAMKSKEAIREWIGPWLAAQDTFWLPMKEGFKLTTIPKWKENLHGALAFLKKISGEDIDVDEIEKDCIALYERAKEYDYGEATPAIT